MNYYVIKIGIAYYAGSDCAFTQRQSHAYLFHDRASAQQTIDKESLPSFARIVRLRPKRSMV
jgi:hypothetical protein